MGSVEDELSFALSRFDDEEKGPALAAAMAREIRRFMVLRGLWEMGTTCEVRLDRADVVVHWPQDRLTHSQA